jgi:hypothetical protein
MAYVYTGTVTSAHSGVWSHVDKCVEAITTQNGPTRARSYASWEVANLGYVLRMLQDSGQVQNPTVGLSRCSSLPLVKFNIEH